MNIIKTLIGLTSLLSIAANADSNFEQSYEYDYLTFTKEVIKTAKEQTVFSTNELIQTIANQYPYFGLGDDGIDCPTKVFNLEITKEKKSSLEFSFDSQQEYAGNGACFSWPVRCNAVMAFNERTIIDCYEL